MSLLRTRNGILFLALQRLCRITHRASASINPMPINNVARVHPEPLSIYEPAGADRGRRHISSPSSLSASIYVQTGGNSYAGHLRLTGRRRMSQKMEGEKKERKRGSSFGAVLTRRAASQPCTKSSSSADLLCCVTTIDLMKGINTGRPHGQRRPHKARRLPQCWCCLYFGPADVLPGELCVRVDANKIKLLYPHTPHLSGNTDRAHLRARSSISADGGG